MVVVKVTVLVVQTMTVQGSYGSTDAQKARAAAEAFLNAPTRRLMNSDDVVGTEHALHLVGQRRADGHRVRRDWSDLRHRPTRSEERPYLSS